MAVIEKDQDYELTELEYLIGRSLCDLKKDALAGKLVIKKDFNSVMPLS